MKHFHTGHISLVEKYKVMYYILQLQFTDKLVTIQAVKKTATGSFKLLAAAQYRWVEFPIMVRKVKIYI